MGRQGDLLGVPADVRAVPGENLGLVAQGVEIAERVPHVGVPRDQADAMRWLQLANSPDTDGPPTEWATVEGFGIAEDQKQAAYWYELAAQKGIRPRPLLLKIAPDLNQQQMDDVIGLALEIQLDGSHGCLQLMRNGINESVVLFVPADFAQQKDSIQHDPADDGREKQYAENEQDTGSRN